MAFRAFDIHVPELGIRDIQFLPSPGQMIRFIVLYEHHSKKHLKLYALDASNKQIIDHSPLLSSLTLPDSTSTIIPSTCPVHLPHSLSPEPGDHRLQFATAADPVCPHVN